MTAAINTEGQYSEPPTSSYNGSMRFNPAFLTVLLMPLLTGAATDICTDLYSLSCVHGLIDDGTGSSVMVSQSHTVDPETQRQTIENFLKNDLPSVRKQAGENLQLSCNNGIKGDLDNSAVCDLEIQAKIIELINRRRLTGTNGRYTGAELQFMEEFGFLKLLNQVQFSNLPPVDIRAQEEKVAKLFPQIKEALLEKIRKSPLPPDKKSAVFDQINRVNNGGTDCGKVLGPLTEEYLPKAFYNPGNGSFFLCRNLLNQVNSEFALVTIIAHEISHSIDSCSLPISNPTIFGHYEVNDLKKGDRASPFAELITCLRSPHSVEAKNYHLKSLSQDNLKEGETMFNYCEQTDQISEATSDWFASEVLTDVISKNHPGLTQDQWRNGFRNTFRAKCDQQNPDIDFEPHPALRDRFNANILANSAVRKKMGCAPAHTKVQCSFDGTPTSANATSERVQRSAPVSPKNSRKSGQE